MGLPCSSMALTLPGTAVPGANEESTTSSVTAAAPQQIAEMRLHPPFPSCPPPSSRAPYDCPPLQHKGGRTIHFSKLASRCRHHSLWKNDVVKDYTHYRLSRHLHIFSNPPPLTHSSKSASPVHLPK